jgi:hypothetical protein
MARWAIGLALGLAVAAGSLLAQEGPQRAKIKKVDAARGRVTLTVGKEDQEFEVTKRTLLKDEAGKDLADRLEDKRLKAGAAVMFKAQERDGRRVLIGMKLAGKGGGGGPPGPRITKDTSYLKPLTEMGKEKYRGYQGGLYPGGKNVRPAGHEKAGLSLAAQVVPRDAEGKPSADGKIVLLSVGMSNTDQISQGFKQALRDTSGINPQMRFVNGAQGGMTAEAIQDPDDNGRGTKYWTEVDRRLKGAGVTRAQVQAIWIKQADARPGHAFPVYARKLNRELRKIVQLLPERFPNVKLVYLSSRTYGGYARTPLNPEPYAFESGFSVKWLIGEQIEGDRSLNYDSGKGAVKAPWLSWGPYLWANGTSKSADGFTSEESDFVGDGTHHSAAGVRKMGKRLLEFFKSDTTTKPWFLAKASE